MIPLISNGTIPNKFGINDFNYIAKGNLGK